MKFILKILNLMKIKQFLKKAETKTLKPKTLKVDDAKFDDNFRFYPTGRQYKDQMAQLQTNVRVVIEKNTLELYLQKLVSIYSI